MEALNLAFTLSMPNVGSWNGKWSSAGKLFCVIKKFGASKKAWDKHGALAGRSFYYNFGDGWGASVSVKAVSGKEITALRKKSAGFCGYDWMIDEILEHGRIVPRHEREKAA